ncbi:MAG: EAL domain-containing protein [Treponemataceae bacterium]|nr:EAL domain-containing protein [Treponemataceae bacterium]
MHYNFNFDIAALLIYVVVIIFFFTRRKVSNFQDRCFARLLIVCTLTAVGDLSSAMMTNFGTNTKFGMWLANMLYFLCNMCISPLYATYALSLTEFFKRNFSKSSPEVDYSTRRMVLIALLIPFLLTEIFVIASPIFATQNLYKLTVFYINQECEYIRGGIPFLMIYIVTAYYCILAFMILMMNRKELRVDGKLAILISFFTVSLIGLVIQTLFQHILVQCFCISMAAIVFSYNVQRPEDYIDSTTGAFNRKSMTSMLSRQFMTGNSFLAVGIIFDDLNFLSNTFGINQIEYLMKKVFLELKEVFPKTKIFCIDKEKFCVVWKDKPDDIDAIVKKMESRLGKVWQGEYKVTFKLYGKICWMICPEEAKSAEEILDIISTVSDDDRYKNEVICARQIDKEIRHRTLYIEHELRKGLSEDLFQVYYQPIYSVHEKRFIGAEALIRLKDENGNFISPAEFIPIAEKNGTILRIGQICLESVCKMLSMIGRPGDFGIRTININLSVCQCMQDLMSEIILRTINKYRLDPDLFSLELTETASPYTPEILEKNMEKLDKTGVHLILDGYGSGYSNLNYMLNFPFQIVKIDKKLVWSAFEDEKKRAAIFSSIKLIQQLGKSVLAEGVESAEQAEWLESVGVEYLQGYYFEKPLPESEFLHILGLGSLNSL